MLTPGTFGITDVLGTLIPTLGIHTEKIPENDTRKFSFRPDETTCFVRTKLRSRTVLSGLFVRTKGNFRPDEDHLFVLTGTGLRSPDNGDLQPETGFLLSSGRRLIFVRSKLFDPPLVRTKLPLRPDEASSTSVLIFLQLPSPRN